MASLKDKVVLITGASSGIGEAMTLEFAKKGSKLAIVGRNVDNLKKTAKLCYDVGRKEEEVCIIKGDISVEADVRRMCQELTDHFKTVDVIINNAGGVTDEGIFDLDLAALDARYAEFIRSPALIVHLLLPHLTKNKGNVINMSSVSSVVASPTFSYDAIKAGMDHMTRCMALELAPHGVRANTINPGCVDTPIWNVASKELIDMAYKNCPLGRAARPEEIAKLAVFVASDDAAYITGSSHLIDGGWALTSYLTTLMSQSEAKNN